MLATLKNNYLRGRRLCLRWLWYARHLLFRGGTAIVTEPPAGPPLHPRAICLLTVFPDPTQLDFFRRIPGYDVHVVCDANDRDLGPLRDKYGEFTFVRMEEMRCLRSGYRQLNAVVKLGIPSAWDKAMCYFAEVIPDRYDHVWFLESDVLVPATDTLPAIDANHGDAPDLLCQALQSFADVPDWYFWSKHLDTSLPRVRCQASAIRASNTFIGHVRAYAAARGRLMFLESFLPSLAVRDGLRIAQIPELDTIGFHERWDPAGIERRGLYHPVRDLAVHAAVQRRFA